MGHFFHQGSNLQRLLRGSETGAEPSDADEIGQYDTDIDVTHRMQRSLAHSISGPACNAGNISTFFCIYKYVDTVVVASGFVVAGRGKLRYTPQVRGSQRSFDFPRVSGSVLQPTDTVV